VRRSGLSRNTVRAALRSSEPPKYLRSSTNSKLDTFKDEIHRLLRADPKLPGQRVRELIALPGFEGGKTIVDDYLREVRPLFAGVVERLQVGPPGTGKTHLVIALGIRACLAGQRVLFRTATEWVALPADAQRHGRLDDELARLQRISLLIYDEVRLHTLRSPSRQPHVHARLHALERASLIVTSNRPFSAWGEIFGDEVTATAMIDRLVHHAEILSLKGDSYRLKDRDLAPPRPPATDPSARARPCCSASGPTGLQLRSTGPGGQFSTGAKGHLSTGLDNSSASPARRARRTTRSSDHASATPTVTNFVPWRRDSRRNRGGPSVLLPRLRDQRSPRDSPLRRSRRRRGRGVLADVAQRSAVDKQLARTASACRSQFVADHAPHQPALPAARRRQLRHSPAKPTGPPRHGLRRSSGWANPFCAAPSSVEYEHQGGPGRPSGRPGTSLACQGRRVCPALSS